jgi:hypothetical protein
MNFSGLEILFIKTPSFRGFSYKVLQAGGLE